MTIHWKSPKWIDVQQRMIHKCTDAPHRVYGWCDEIPGRDQLGFDVVMSGDASLPHEEKLDLLAQRVLDDSSNESDWMIFMDGDAFPVRPVCEKIAEYLRTHELVAIQRLENEGEQHAHPSFCVTTVGFWRRHLPSWRKGYQWTTPQGTLRTDVGGDLLGLLIRENIPWKPLHRSNKVNLHPVLFGVYDNLVYHHGTGFRSGSVVREERWPIEHVRTRFDARMIMKITPKKWRKKIRNSFLHPEGRILRRLSKRNAKLNTEVTGSLMHDPEKFIATLI